MSRGFLVARVGEHVFSVSAILGEPTFAEVARLAQKHGYEIKVEGFRKSFGERSMWPLDLRAYTSFHSDGCGRSGSSLWSWPAREISCGYCKGSGHRGGGFPTKPCKRCNGLGVKAMHRYLGSAAI